MITNPRTYAVCTLAAAATLALAGCGGAGSSGSSTTDGSAPSSTAGNGSGTGGRAGFGGRAPGVSGLIAAVQGSTLQVQTRTDQTAVTYSPATTIRAEVAVASSTLRVGDCVSARPAFTPDAGTGGPSAGGGTAANSGSAANGGSAANSGSPSAPTTVPAATVQIISTGGSGCTFGGNRPGTVPGRAPTGRPTGQATEGGPRAGGFAGRGGGTGGFGAVGTVASIGTGTFTVTEAGFGARTAGAATAASPTSTPPTRTVTVTFTGTTRFSESRKSTAAAIKVGECVAAQGAADDTGAVSATSLSISPATDGRCSIGFGRG